MPIMKGSAMDNGELPPVKCTYPQCHQHFATEKDMKKHKQDNPEHSYCRKCNMDCEDWEALLQHKIDAMSPWLEGKMMQYARDTAAAEDDKNNLPAPKHIVCEFCGADFKSFGGRKRHRAQVSSRDPWRMMFTDSPFQEHAANQSITCPGCRAYFIRAAMLVQHLEDGRCSVVTRHEFLGSIRQKHFLKAIFKAPDEYLAALEVNKALPLGIEVGLEAMSLSIENLRMDDHHREVPLLLDQDDATQGKGYVPMIPSKLEADLIDFNEDTSSAEGTGYHGSYSRVNDEKWPRLPGMPPAALPNRTLSTIVSSSTTSVNEGSEAEDGTITSRRGGVKVQAGSYASRGSEAMVDPGPDTVPRSVTFDTKKKTNAWCDGRLSQKLTEQNVQALPKANSAHWSSYTRHRRDTVEDHKHGNILYSHWWDPSSEDYSIDRFLAYVEVPKLDSRTGRTMIDLKTNKPIIESIIWKYCCPDPDCKARFENSEDFETHWIYGHGQLQWRCPCCLKLFRSVASLVGHCESNSKCGVKYSDQFQMVSECSWLESGSRLILL
nr:hypothetical protein CFP56_03114 [Quercus suber]